MSTQATPAFRKLARIRTLLSFAPLFVTLVLSGCDSDTTKPDPEPSPYLAPTSPENVVDNIVTAMNLRDADGYAANFDEEEFIFRFDPIDLILDNDLPPFWDYDGETAWSSNCFESSDVFRVSVEWAKGPVEELDESDPDNYMDPTMRKMVVVGIYLEVEMVNPADPSDPILFLASGDRARFYFAPDLNHLIGGQPTWKIVEWQDIRVEGRPLLSENNSIGRIKAAFR